ncbi:hypothetical protein AVEN_99092-1 [Araneus ventricosus]|uniref:Uncharacterized protein n=1 Tax=Araneus ventricosus TaxID=182803 RepID=A0A4Y2K4T5_ARAVE|nr:hypothetical protein AVEN_99092-1 [Araneus ventricosus]
MLVIITMEQKKRLGSVGFRHPRIGALNQRLRPSATTTRNDHFSAEYVSYNNGAKKDWQRWDSNPPRRDWCLKLARAGHATRNTFFNWYVSNYNNGAKEKMAAVGSNPPQKSWC